MRRCEPVGLRPRMSSPVPEGLGRPARRSAKSAGLTCAGARRILSRPHATGAEAVPYSHNFELPPTVRGHLPEHAQDIYREAFNHAFAAHTADPRQEEAAHRIAWAAVKRRYVKAGDSWVERSS